MALKNLNLKEKKSGIKALHKNALHNTVKSKYAKKEVCKQSSERLWNKLTREKSSKDLKTREQLIMHYAYLVNWVVYRLPLNALKGMDKDDLIGYGTIGLIEAVDRFDHTRNSSFESFAVTRIRGSIYDQLRAQDHLSRGSRKRVKDLLKAAGELEQRLGRYPSDNELAQELSISLEELRQVQQEAQIGIFSLDENRGNGEDALTLTETISSNSESIVDELEETELRKRLEKAINTLPERERTVIGLYHFKQLTFKAIAEIMSFSESRASQLHARAISMLKAKMLAE